MSNLGIIGRRGEGKSTLALFIALRMQKTLRAHTIVIFDPKRTFKNVDHTNDLEVFDDLIEKPSASGAIAYQPYQRHSDSDETIGIQEEFENFCDALGIEKHLGDERPSRPDLGPVILIVDEAWLLQGGSQINPWMEQLVRLADLETFFLIQLAHRPGDFSPRVRAQLDELFIFRQFLPADLKVIEEMAGPEVASLVENLPSHHVIDFHVHSGKFENWNEPRNWFIDISKNSLGVSHNGATAGNESGPRRDSDVRGPNEGASGNDASARVGSESAR